MKPVFADTSYYLALVNPRDSRHERAVELSEMLLGRIFVTEYVLVELGSALARGSDRIVYLETLQDVKTDGYTLIIPASQALFGDGLALFASRLDKDWSLVDCISLVVMKKRRLTEALTTDHHFVQAGFHALLR
jgi:predicted nucleic acid-binding protein